MRFTADGVMASRLCQKSGNFIISATDGGVVVALEASVAAESLSSFGTKPADQRTMAQVTNVTSETSNLTLVLLDAGTLIKSPLASA